MTYRVLIADDHPLARKAIQSVLQVDSSFYLVGEATNGEEALFLCGELQPDLILMDIHMPVMDGLEATFKIKQAFPGVKIVILSVSDDIADLFTAIQYGAQGYLLKNLDPDEWLSYLHALIEGKADVSRNMAGKLFGQFRETDPSMDQNMDSLTVREREILIHVAAGETNRELAISLGISENTAKNHVKNLLNKLNLENRVQLASFAINQGLVKKQ